MSGSLRARLEALEQRRRAGSMVEIAREALTCMHAPQQARDPLLATRLRDFRIRYAAGAALGRERHAGSAQRAGKGGRPTLPPGWHVPASSAAPGAPRMPFPAALGRRQAPTGRGR